MTGIMSGYSLTIRQLHQEDVELHKIDMNDVPIEECIAILPADLGECLGAVVHLKHNADDPLIWSDADGEGKPIPNEFVFADAVATLLVSLFPHLTAIE